MQGCQPFPIALVYDESSFLGIEQLPSRVVTSIPVYSEENNVLIPFQPIHYLGSMYAKVCCFTTFYSIKIKLWKSGEIKATTIT